MKKEILQKIALESIVNKVEPKFGLIGKQSFLIKKFLPNNVKINFNKKRIDPKGGGELKLEKVVVSK